MIIYLQLKYTTVIGLLHCVLATRKYISAHDAAACMLLIKNSLPQHARHYTLGAHLVAFNSIIICICYQLLLCLLVVFTARLLCVSRGKRYLPYPCLRRCSHTLIPHTNERLQTCAAEGTVIVTYNASRRCSSHHVD